MTFDPFYENIRGGRSKIKWTPTDEDVEDGPLPQLPRTHLQSSPEESLAEAPLINTPDGKLNLPPLTPENPSPATDNDSNRRQSLENDIPPENLSPTSSRLESLHSPPENLSPITGGDRTAGENEEIRKQENNHRRQRMELLEDSSYVEIAAPFTERSVLCYHPHEFTQALELPKRGIARGRVLRIFGVEPDSE